MEDSDDVVGAVGTDRPRPMPVIMPDGAPQLAPLHSSVAVPAGDRISAISALRVSPKPSHHSGYRD
jgi:hypothetical protein